MTHIRIRYKKLGGHIHCRVFTSQNGPGYTYANCGSLVFDEREWPEVQDKLSRCELINDEQPKSGGSGSQTGRPDQSESGAP